MGCSRTCNGRNDACSADFSDLMVARVGDINIPF